MHYILHIYSIYITIITFLTFFLNCLLDDYHHPKILAKNRLQKTTTIVVEMSSG